MVRGGGEITFKNNIKQHKNAGLIPLPPVSPFVLHLPWECSKMTLTGENVALPRCNSQNLCLSIFISVKVQ